MKMWIGGGRGIIEAIGAKAANQRLDVQRGVHATANHFAVASTTPVLAADGNDHVTCLAVVSLLALRLDF